MASSTKPQDDVVKPKTKEVLIDGRVYDVTKFKHPGGSIINFMLDADATDVYREMHYRSQKKADKLLKALPSREFGSKEGDKKQFFTYGEVPAVSDDASTAAPDSSENEDELGAIKGEERKKNVERLAKNRERNEKLIKEFRELEEQLKKEGLFDPCIPHVIWRMTELVLLHVIGVYVCYAYGWIYTGLAIVGIGQGRCGWFMHEGGHGSLTGNLKIDRRIQEFFYGFGDGMSGAWWRNNHNKHHATPQKIEHDVDLNTLPLVCFHHQVATESKIGKALMKNKFYREYWLKYQNIIFGPLTCLLVALGWQLYLHPHHALRTKNYIELVWMALRYVSWFLFLPYALTTGHGGVVPGQLSMMGYYLWYVEVGSSMIFINFAMSHTHLDVVQKDEHVNWVQYSSRYTVNVENCYLVNWWMSYLNFQIEHHLFPQCPQFRFPRISHRVKEVLERNGETYKVFTYWEGLQVTFQNLRDQADEALQQARIEAALRKKGMIDADHDAVLQKEHAKKKSQ
jgi:fatty acid desaturase